MMMRTRLNLSRYPFTNRRLFWLGVAAVFFISLWLFLYISAERSRVSAEAERISSQMRQREELVNKARKDQEDRAKQQQPKTELTDQQRKELASARLLIGRRVLSMNKLIADIEDYVPPKTRITGIRIEEVYSAGQDAVAVVEVKAAGASYEEMKEMWTRIVNSGGPFTLNEPATQEAKNDKNELPYTEVARNEHAGQGASFKKRGKGRPPCAAAARPQSD
jgi:5'-3' exonuclease